MPITDDCEICYLRQVNICIQYNNKQTTELVEYHDIFISWYSTRYYVTHGNTYYANKHYTIHKPAQRQQKQHCPTVVARRDALAF